MRRKAMTLRELAAILAVLGFLSWILWPITTHTPYNKYRHDCQFNLKQISLAVHMYAQDADEKMPSLRSLQGWQGAIAPYVKDRAKFACPSDELEANLTDYWFNARLSEIKEEDIENFSTTFMLGDGYATDDPNVSISELPLAWRKNEKSPMWRHLDGANFAFADGHVKWLKAAKNSSDEEYSFRPEGAK